MNRFVWFSSLLVGVAMFTGCQACFDTFNRCEAFKQHIFCNHSLCNTTPTPVYVAPPAVTTVPVVQQPVCPPAPVCPPCTQAPVVSAAPAAICQPIECCPTTVCCPTTCCVSSCESGCNPCGGTVSHGTYGGGTIISGEGNCCGNSGTIVSGGTIMGDTSGVISGGANVRPSLNGPAPAPIASGQ
ncbi:MAG: hypothetical protein SFX18_16810 [Pirellulales bacterium]|nr:hypothetical protein [Pirellulales bacterium]